MSPEIPERLERVLVSACLLGRECRYDGRHNRDGELERELAARGLEAVPFCPEEAGGLGTPRAAAWIEQGGAAAVLDGRSRMVDERGADVTAEFVAGARGGARAVPRRGARAGLLEGALALLRVRADARRGSGRRGAGGHRGALAPERDRDRGHRRPPGLALVGARLGLRLGPGPGGHHDLEGADAQDARADDPAVEADQPAHHGRVRRDVLEDAEVVGEAAEEVGEDAVAARGHDLEAGALAELAQALLLEALVAEVEVAG